MYGKVDDDLRFGYFFLGSAKLRQIKGDAVYAAT